MSDAILTPELLRRLEQFQLLAARRAKSSARGERRSRARGQSVEFADFRNYVPGDDFRYLDWNLFARLDRLFLKLYEEERELPVRLFLDASESMTFGTPRKFDFARQAAAAIGYIALCGFDRVSVHVFPDAGLRMGSDGTNGSATPSQSAIRNPQSAIGPGAGGAGGEGLPPRPDPVTSSHSSQSAIRNPQSAIESALRSVRGKKSALQFFQNLSVLRAGGSASLNESLRRGASEVRNKGLAVVLSDFLDPAGYEAGLNALVGRGFQVDIIQILSPEELEPATYGDLRLVDAETGALQEVTFGRFRLAAYQRSAQAYVQRLREFCQSRGIHFFLARSDMDLGDLVLKQLRKAEVVG